MSLPVARLCVTLYSKVRVIEKPAGGCGYVTKPPAVGPWALLGANKHEGGIVIDAPFRDIKSSTGSDSEADRGAEVPVARRRH
jgi:hypothetical protein